MTNENVKKFKKRLKNLKRVDLGLQHTQEGWTVVGNLNPLKTFEKKKHAKVYKKLLENGIEKKIEKLKEKIDEEMMFQEHQKQQKIRKESKQEEVWVKEEAPSLTQLSSNED